MLTAKSLEENGEADGIYGEGDVSDIEARECDRIVGVTVVKYCLLETL